MITNELCKECVNTERCLVRYYEPFIELCPCTTCLISAMCTVQCKERIDLYDDIPDYDKTICEIKQKELNDEGESHDKRIV